VTLLPSVLERTRLRHLHRFFCLWCVFPRVLKALFSSWRHGASARQQRHLSCSEGALSFARYFVACTVLCLIIGLCVARKTMILTWQVVLHAHRVLIFNAAPRRILRSPVYSSDPRPAAYRMLESLCYVVAWYSPRPQQPPQRSPSLGSAANASANGDEPVPLHDVFSTFQKKRAELIAWVDSLPRTIRYRLGIGHSPHSAAPPYGSWTHPSKLEPCRLRSPGVPASAGHAPSVFPILGCLLGGLISWRESYDSAL